MSPGCAEHAERAAVFRCDGCGRLLCDECVELGHRLFFCRWCRERALPLEAGAPATPAARVRALRAQRPDSLASLLGYPVRGRNALTLAAYVLTLTLAALLPLPLALAVTALIALLLPGLLLQIVRATYEGDDDLPDWPDFAALGARLGDWLRCAAVAAVAALPWLLLRRLAGCDVEDFLRPAGDACATVTALGLAGGCAISLFGLGAVGAFDSAWLAPRLDLHLEALLRGTRGEALVFLLATGLVLGAAGWSARALAEVPGLGIAVFHAATGYALLETAHLAGVLFRRHRERLEGIYLG